MAEEFSVDKAREIIEGGIGQAQEVLADPTKIDDLLGQMQAKVAQLPEVAAGVAANVPTMVEMVKGYVTKEYAEVSPKVIATLVSAFLYLVSKKDIIPDNVPVLGMVDDIAVIGLALKLNEPELEAFKAWKEAQVAGA